MVSVAHHQKSPNLYNIYRFFKLLFKPKSPEMLTSNRLLKVPSHLFSCLYFQALWHVTLQVFLPPDTDLGHLIFPGHWHANGHDACYQESKQACSLGLLSPPSQEQALAQGSYKTCQQ